uniref:GNVR domain-containing protein n=1 Tax=Thermovirga lienii TaxID=336261 RepID=UPI002FE04160
ELEQYEGSILKSALNSQSSASLAVFSEYLKKRKEWFAQQMLYQRLQSLYDKAVLQEKTLNVSVVSLGSAPVPDKPFKPNKKLLLAVGVVLGLFIGVFLAFFMEFFHRASEDPEEREKVKLIKEAFTLKGFFKS